jgi:hypothetical protein
LFDALSGAIEFPTVEAAANAIAFNPTHRELGLAMGTAKIYDVGCAVVAAIESEGFAHDFDRLGPAHGQIFRAIDRMPKLSHVPTCQGARPGVVKIHEIDHQPLLLLKVLSLSLLEFVIPDPAEAGTGLSIETVRATA